MRKIIKLDEMYCNLFFDELVNITLSSGDKRLLWSDEQFLKSYSSKWKLSLVMVDNYHPIGFIIGTSRSKKLCHINLFIVDNKFKGNRYGSMLLLAFEKNAKEYEYSNVNLFVYEDSKAIKFYEDRGYRITNNKIADNGSPQFIMYKEL